MAVTRYGSQGDEVKRLQQALNGAGYNLAEDGIFGEQTQKAVKNYQTANGLSVDGIAGPQTWASLNSRSAPAAAQATANTTNPEQAAIPVGTQAADVKQPSATETLMQAPTYQQTQALSQAIDQMAAGMQGGQGFTPSQGTQDALAALNTAAAAKPAAYQSKYQQTLDDLYNQALNRQQFGYDYSADPLYLAYKDRYSAAAKQAMTDSMANAAALTGGYGNSYAAAAGQQAYDQQMQGLNDMLPELYSQAYGRYNDQYSDLLKQIQLAQSMDETDYARSQDRLADYYNELEARRALANDQYSRDYAQYTDALDQLNKNRTFGYGLYGDVQAAELAAAAAEAAAASGSSGGGSGKSSAGKSADYKTVLATAQGLTKQKAYDYVGRMVDGGYITPEEGARILGVEMGLDLSQFTDDANGADSADRGATTAASSNGGRNVTLGALADQALAAKQAAQSTVARAAENGNSLSLLELIKEKLGLG